MSEERNAVRFRQAAALLPPHLRRPVERLDGTSQARVEELRLRAGRPLTLVCPEGERTVPGAEAPVRSMDLSLVLEIATQASTHTALERVRNGFFTVRGGHRIGICGSGVVRDGEVRNLRQLSSLAIRVAREVPGLSAAVLDRLWSGGVLQSTLLLSPPGGGKTTLLRLLQRQYEYDGAISVPVPLDCFPSPVSAPERDTLTILEEQEPGLELWRIYKELDMLEVDAGVLFRPYSSLSGGEQVKVLLAALFLREGAFLLLDEPTRGIDVGAKYEIYQIMIDLVKQGKSIIMISSEMPELIGMSNRIIVMCNGHITGEVEGEDATQEKIMSFATKFTLSGKENK